jgi:hypothetical protein
MRLEYQWVDIEPFLDGDQQPTVIIRRGAPTKLISSNKVYPGLWYVAVEPIGLNGSEPVWSVIKNDEFVRVPLFSYTTLTKSAESLFGTGIQLGIMTVHGLKAKVTVEKMFLAIGNVFETDAGYQSWLGIALRTG